MMKLFILVLAIASWTPVRSNCTICPDRSTIPDPSRVVSAPNGGNLTCGFLSIFNASQCEDVFPVQVLCGCPGPEGGCDICFDGSPVPDPSLVLPDVNNTDCNTLSLAAALDVQGTPNTTISCPEWQGIGILCGCPRSESACTLCEDKSDIPNPDLVVEEDTTCQSLSAQASSLPPDLCLNMQATAGVYCGCDNPVASEGYCRICGGDTLLPDTSILGEPDTSCGQLEANFEMVDCEELQSKYFDVCCPGITKETEAPVAAPTEDAPVADPPTSNEAPEGSSDTLSRSFASFMYTIVLMGSW